MPFVDITRREAEQNQLPPVCMCCGRPAWQTRQVDFFDGSGRILLYAPLCQRHRNHFTLRSRVLILGLAGSFIFLMFVPFVFGDAIGVPPRETKILILLLWLALGLAGIIATVVLFLVLKHNGIRIARVTHSTIKLTGVSVEFVEAFLEQRASRKGTGNPAASAERAGADDPLAAIPIAEDARRAFAEARSAALQLEDDHLGTQHLLIGLRNALPGVAAYLLKDLGIDECDIRATLEPGQANAPPPKEVPLTPAVRRVLYNAVQEARLPHNVLVSSEYILLALLDERDSEAVHILRSLGVDLENLRERIVNASQQGQFRPRERMEMQSESFKAVD